MLCYCNSGHLYAKCCEPYVSGLKKRDSALVCMRSRYTAYCLKNIDYLIESTYPTQRKYYPRKSLVNWANSVKWLKLEILQSTESIVEFKAYFTGIDSTKIQIHHEKSQFKITDGSWFFFEGEVF